MSKKGIVVPDVGDLMALVACAQGGGGAHEERHVMSLSGKNQP